jgi:serine/threonine protein kinase
MSIRGDLERQLVKEVVSRYRALPESQRSQLPALLNAVGKLEVAAGDFQSAQKDFSRVAEIVSDAPARAEAHFNAYRASLERRDWAAALPEILAAAKLDPVHFAPFPMRKYRPVRILGAGGFGVAFLCHHERVQSQVVVKTLVADDLDRSLTDVFAEARVLRQLDHPGIIGLRDCDYADDAMTRPYLEMDYFESQSLEEHVQQHGVLTETAALDIARQIATALQATHRQNVLHRDVKPGNVLIRNDNGQWRAKLIDFGLALGTDRLLSSASSRTLRGSSIAGTIDYAAPEQLGKLPNLPVTPASDVFGFARTIYFAMFQTPHPKARHFEKLSKSLRTLLDDCSSDAPAERPQSFDDVLTRLGVKSAAPPASTGAKSGSDFWGATADFFRKTFGPVNSKPSATQKPVAAAEAPKPPPVPTTEPKLPAEVLEVLPIPQPTSEGIEIIDDLPMVQAIEEVQPVRSPNGTNRSK